MIFHVIAYASLIYLSRGSIVKKMAHRMESNLISCIRPTGQAFFAFDYFLII